MSQPSIPNSRKIMIVLTLIAAASVGAWILLVGLIGNGGGAEAAGLQGPMVQLPTTDGFSLFWNLAGGGEARVIVAEEDGREQEFTVEPEDGRYVLRIDGLSAGTPCDYVVRVETEEGIAEAEGRTRTAPPRGSSFRFLAFGDSGSGYPEQYKLAKVMESYEPELIVHTGDLIYPDGALRHYPSKFYEPNAALLRRCAFFPCLGNHDYNDVLGEPMRANFLFPGNGPEGMHPEQYYWFDFGDVRFVCLDSNDAFSDMRKIVPWLDRVLGDAGDRWRVLFFHHPCYTDGSHTPSGKIRELVVPLADKWNVELVLVGHNHMHERTRAIRGGEVVPDGEGTVYITTGAGGAALQKFRQEQSEFIVTRNNEIHSFTVVDVTPAEMNIRQIDINNEVMDEFSLPKRPEPAPREAATAPAS
jgi:hypothetical protein